MAPARRRQRAPVGPARASPYPRARTGEASIGKAGETDPGARAARSEGAGRDLRADRAADLAARALIGMGRALPYRIRIPAAGRAIAALSGRLGWDARIEENLGHVRPDMPEAARARIRRGVPDNVGRSLMEMYSGGAFLRRTRHLPLEGPGAPALEAARRAGRPIVGVTAHYGNYNAARAALVGAGHDMGSLYRPMRNASFDAHYTRAMESLGGVMFRQGRPGIAQMVRHLRGGGLLAILQDLWIVDGTPMPFLGKPTATSLSAAELALRYDALLVTFYGVRQPDGLSFRVRIGPEVPRSEPLAMTAALSADLEEMIERHPEQWFWIHRRWKDLEGMGGEAGPGA